jgi:hypothetical protein
MQAIRILANCSTSVRGYRAGEVVVVGEAVSERDAVLLVRMGRAAEMDAAAPQSAQAQQDDPAPLATASAPELVETRPATKAPRRVR